ncbi:MAG: hypothetical protein ACI8PZ_005157 [Myxococcota bacterium]|jgi:hypothetical protein
MVTTVAVAALDPEALGLARACGLSVPTVADAEAASLAEVVLLGGQDAAGRLAGWRIRGLGTGAVLCLPHDADAVIRRAFLEPVAVVRGEDPADVEQAIRHLARGQARKRLRLPMGDVDLARLRVLRPDGSEVMLTQREADVLAYLAARSGRGVSREELQLEVWGHKRASSNTRAVDMAMSRLRKKIERDPAAPETLLMPRSAWRASAHRMPHGATSWWRSDSPRVLPRCSCSTMWSRWMPRWPPRCAPGSSARPTCGSCAPARSARAWDGPRGWRHSRRRTPRRSSPSAFDGWVRPRPPRTTRGCWSCSMACPSPSSRRRARRVRSHSGCWSDG